MTAPKAEVENPAVRERATEMTDAIRVYVLRVAASVSARRAGTAERAERLLQPLRAWTSAASTVVEKESDEPVNDADEPSDPANDDADAEPLRNVG